jgi:hypothetical protein
MNEPEYAEAPGYSHTRQSPTCLLLYGSALACSCPARAVGETPGIVIGGVGLLVALLATAFHHPSAVDPGDA